MLGAHTNRISRAASATDRSLRGQRWQTRRVEGGATWLYPGVMLLIVPIALCMAACNRGYDCSSSGARLHVLVLLLSEQAGGEVGTALPPPGLPPRGMQAVDVWAVLPSPAPA